MARRLRLLLVGLLAIVAVGVPAPGVESAAAAQLERDETSASTVAAPTARIAAAHGRHRPWLGRAVESPPRRDLRRRAAAVMGHAQDRGRLDRGHPQHLERADRPGRAQHDRGPARRDVADRGHGRRLGRRGEGVGPDDRRAARRHPAGRRDRDRAGALPSDPAQLAVGVELAVHPCERRGRSLSLAALGQPGARRSTGRTTATRSRRR